MRYPAPEKLEIIRLVEQSHLPVRRTLEKLGIPRATFYRLYDTYQRRGPEALADQPSRPSRIWNRLPMEVREQIVALALEQPELSPRELAVRFTDERRYFVSEAVNGHRSLRDCGPRKFPDRRVWWSPVISRRCDRGSPSLVAGHGGVEGVVG